MRVERLELVGFKSFSEKTAFNFHPGITAIVGPNGCGKSNIVDAFKWVLGEQSAKSLRGGSMEDVIFAGSVTKKQKGMGEVTLTLSGAAGNEEISVTRRLFRSGESEYLMNKVQCRLKDIKDVFLDTGLELKAYSILEQGRMDEILNSKPQDRRFLIEEVAGVMKYKVRRAEALQKLEASQINLQRLQDIIAEVKRQINSIDRYAKKAERYKKLFEEIKGLEIKIAVRDTGLLDRELSGLIMSENTHKSREARLSSSIHSTEALIEQKKLVCLENEKKLNEIQTRLYSSEKEVTECEGQIALLKNDCENLRGRSERLLLRDGELTASMESISVQSKEAEENDIKINSELSGIEDTLTAEGVRFAEMEHEIQGLDQALESERKQLFNKAEAVSVFKNEISNLTSLVEDLNKKERRDFEDINSVKDKLSSLKASLQELKDTYLKLEQAIKDKTESRENFLDGMNRKKEEQSGMEERLYKEREELASMISRLNSLIEVYRDNKDGIGENIKILCQVADIFESPPEYETAIEAALGEKLNAAVVDDHDEVKKALWFIKEHKISRSAFMPTNINSPALIPQPGAHASGGNIIGKAINLVTVREGFEKIAASLLNDVLVVNNLNTAFELWQDSFTGANGGPKFIVTIEGDVLEPSGVVFGGTEKGILKVKREIKALEANIEIRKNQISEIETAISSLKNNIASAESDIASLTGEISRLQSDAHEIQLRLAGMQEESLSQEKRLQYLSLESDEYRRELDSVQQSLDEKNRTCGTMEEERSVLESKIKGIQGSIADKKDLLEKLRSGLTEIRLTAAALREKIDSLAREKERLGAAFSDIQNKRNEISEERLEIDCLLVLRDEAIKGKESFLKSSVAAISVLQSESSKMKDILEAKTAELSLMEQQMKAYSSEIEGVRKELAQVEIKKAESSLRLKHLKEDIKKSYGIDIIPGEQDQADAVLSEEEERLPSLREKLLEIGPVNLGTLEEFEELKTRYEFLTKQQDDLLQSINSLQDAISKINRTTHKMLIDAFEALNVKFKEVFAILFGKGRAELILTSEDILEAGIEIVAQPPGKKLQSLTLLSGGEKALTALSLLFASFMIKPTPLCLLDEVDAPLDESNTERFTALLAELAKSIQFITITHNRRTMEAADYIYGITMEEPGTSKVISMHMAKT